MYPCGQQKLPGHSLGVLGGHRAREERRLPGVEVSKDVGVARAWRARSGRRWKGFIVVVVAGVVFAVAVIVVSGEGEGGAFYRNAGAEAHELMHMYYVPYHVGLEGYVL